MKAKTVQVAFRLPEWIVEQIDEAAAEMSEEMGFRINRTQAVHKLLLRGIGKGQVARIAERINRVTEILKAHQEDIIQGNTSSPEIQDAVRTFMLCMTALRDLSTMDPGIINDSIVQDAINDKAKVIEMIEKMQ